MYNAIFRKTLTSLPRSSPSFSPPCKYSISRYLSRPKPQIRPFTSSPIRPVVYLRFPSQKSPRAPWSRDTGLKVAAGLFGVGTIYYIAHLEQVPETGRWRFMNTSPKFEAEIGEMARRQSQEEYRDTTLPPNHMLSRHVRRVVSRILAASNLGVVRGGDVPISYINEQSGMTGGDGWDPDTELGVGAGRTLAEEKEWDIMVVNDPKVVNAQVVPGLIIVYTGILPVCQDEQGLAAVLAHEIGHVVARHTAERISSQTVLFALMVLFQVTLGIDFGIASLVQKLLLELPNSRTQELEADRIGLTLMARACFDPRAAPDMFVRLGRIEEQIAGRAGLDFLQTHPSSSSRVKKLEQILPDAYAVLAASPDCAAMQDRLQLFRAAAAGHGVPMVGAGVGAGDDVEMF